MGFLKRANELDQTKREEEASKPKYSGGGGGNRIGDVWLNVGDAMSIRFVEQPAVYDGDQLLQLGNPCCISAVKTWVNRKPKDTFINPSTFGVPDVVEAAREEWFQRRKAEMPAGMKVDWKTCNIPRTQGRFLLWGPVVTFKCGPKTQEIYAEKKLGMKAFEMSDDVWHTLLDFLNKALLKCEDCNRTLSITSVKCANAKCGKTLVNEADSQQYNALELVQAQTGGLFGLTGRDQCPHCAVSLHEPSVVEKHCKKCDEPREGITEETCNIIVTRTGDKTYSFDIDEDYIGGLDCLPEAAIDEIMNKEVKIEFDPKTQAVTSNLWNFQGTTPQQLTKLCEDLGAPKVEARRPANPTVQLSS